MKDHGEGGSRDSASAQQQPAQLPVNAISEPSRNDPDPSLRAGADASETGEAPTEKPVSADMQQFIGRQLRAVFDDVAKQPIPDRFLELMRQLDDKTTGR